ncbi:MAG TPA: ABC transporter substrate-binding protein [Methylomirabilota bacterium]|nr:ABC transporter substrate-binding protein [Methylomirabilota bacterium]
MRVTAMLAALGLVLVVAVPGVGQPRTGPVKIGVLSASWGPTRAVVGLREGLQALGYRENTDFVIGVRFTQGNAAELPAAARELVRLGSDILVTDGSGDATRTARAAATERIPIVFMGEVDPVEQGLVASLARPGGNVTGIADLDAELGPKRLEIFREIVPGLKRVLVPYDASLASSERTLSAYRAAAHRLGLALVERPLRTQEEARAALAQVSRGQVDGIISVRWLTLNIPGFIQEAAARHAAPTMFHDSFFVEQGGLASYAANRTQLGRQAALMIDRIINGAKPADLPVEQPTTFELVINARTAAGLGLTIPPAVLLRADRVIR